jgi:endonuclease/exonuclease/phosphatase family metal-dependent hydrolase
MLRIATFNVENLFERPRAMNLPRWEDGQPAIAAAAELNALFNKDVYAPADKTRMLELLGASGLLTTRPNNDFLEFRLIRGHLFRVPKNSDPEIVANGRADWVGWIDLKKQTIEDQAIENTARVIAEVDADVFCLVEVESRPALQRFVDGFVNPMQKKLGHAPYTHNMLIDGNDERGIDVAILSRFPIARMQTHLFDVTDGRKTFSRDCPEYYVTFDGGKELVLLLNHFASKGSDFSGARRRLQSTAVRKIYEQLRARHDLVVVAGDLNDFPAGGSLAELLTQTDAQDAMALPVYTQQPGVLPGTYGHGNAKEKLDYLLLSPKLVAGAKDVGVFRKGYYAPEKWASFENINKQTKERFQASDHHCVWADVNV